MLNKLGGRKFVLSLAGLITVIALATVGADAASYGAVAIIVGSYAGANGYIEGKHASKESDNG